MKVQITWKQTITTQYVSTFDVPEDVAKAWKEDEPMIYIDEHGDAQAFTPRSDPDEEVHFAAVAHEDGWVAYDARLEVDDTTILDLGDPIE